VVSLGPCGFFAPELSNLIEIHFISSTGKGRVFPLFHYCQLSFMLIKLGVLCLAQSSVIQAMIYSAATVQRVSTV